METNCYDIMEGAQCGRVRLYTLKHEAKHLCHATESILNSTTLCTAKCSYCQNQFCPICPSPPTCSNPVMHTPSVELGSTRKPHGGSTCPIAIFSGVPRGGGGGAPDTDALLAENVRAGQLFCVALRETLQANQAALCGRVPLRNNLRIAHPVDPECQGRGCPTPREQRRALGSLCSKNP